jgi:hypothetical protein
VTLRVTALDDNHDLATFTSEISNWMGGYATKPTKPPGKALARMSCSMSTTRSRGLGRTALL